MPKHSSKTSDINKIAASIVGQATAGITARSEHQKNPHAVSLGRLGGLKGGKARAAKLSPAKRKAIAKKAAQSRWNKRKP